MLQSFSQMQKLLLLFSICAGFIAIGKSYHYTKQYTGTDLECRMRGAKLQAAGYSAYFTRDSTGKTQLNGVTVPPVVLLLHYPLNSLSYSQVRTAWLIIQYLLLLGAIVLLARQLPPGIHNRLFIPAIITAFFMCAAFWQFHTERGQIYVLYLFLFACIYTLYSKNTKTAVFFAGVMLAFAIWTRMLFIVCAIPFLLQKNKPFLSGLIAGLTVFAIASLPFYHQWQDYFAAMSGYTNGNITFVTHTAAAGNQYPSGASLPVNFKNDFVTGCINYTGEYMKRLHILIPHSAILAFYGFIMTLFIVRNKKLIAIYSASQLFCFAFLLYICSEYFTGAGRNAYNLVEWLFPIMLVLPYCKPGSILFFRIVAGLCLLNAFPLYFPYCFELGELLLCTGLLHWLSGGSKMKQEQMKNGTAF
jgi:Glycosyltransferase family 87